MPDATNTFATWRELARDPQAAAREIRRRVTTRLSPAQQRAVVAWLPAEDALTAAFAAAKENTPLQGIPYFLKDLFDLAGVPTFAGSTFLPEVRPTPARSSTIVQALQRTGAVGAGKTQLHEFAFGITGENPHYGDCEHPLFPGRTTGGSSSGSAAAVAAGIVPFAIGTDTGGSVRVPASFCGLYGFRLKTEHPWIVDAFPLSQSCDTAGWFTGSADDMLAANAALVGFGTNQRPLNGCYLEYGDLDPDVAHACREAAAKLTAPAEESLQRELTRGFAPSLAAYGTVVAIQAQETHRPWAEKYRERYDPAVWQRLQRSRPTLIEQEKTIAHLTSIKLLWTTYFLTYDFLVMPATPCAALTKAECTPANRTRLLTLSAPASLGGLPVLTLPVTLPSGLTTGLQVIVNNAQSPVVAWALEKWK